MLRHLLRVAHAKVRAVGKRLRSSQWRKVERDHLALQPACAACGSTKHLQVHHVRPFHLDPKLELDVRNLETLCMDVEECHLLAGHGGSFHTYNPHLRHHLLLLMKEQRTLEQVVAEARMYRLPL